MSASDSPDNSPEFTPTASWSNLRQRAQLLKRLRSFFDERDFFEVETPLLSCDTVIDQHLDPIPVTLFDDPTEPDVGRRMWLQTSPEFSMKRLLAAGAERIYQVTRAFRGGEAGAFHNPEFTMVEWYRVGDSMSEGIELLAELTKELLGVAAVDVISYGEVYERSVGIDPHVASIKQVSAAAESRKIDLPRSKGGDDRELWLDLLFLTVVQPQLGLARPQIVYDYPRPQAALARVRDGEPPVAERFELFVRGVELANGYHELLDADVLRERNRVTNERRRRAGKYPLPEESRLLAAMDHGLPACVGVALGFDRLVMVALDAESIDGVIAFPVRRA